MSLALFSDPELARRLLEGVRILAEKSAPAKIMEVCGTHTMEIGRLGLRALLPDTIELISGPGCPVCVTPGQIIDAAARLAVEKRADVCSFGDMIRVPGNATSLEEARSRGGRVHVVTSPLQLIALAQDAPARQFVFIAVGFETTVPVIARTLEFAAEKDLDNLSFIVCHRLVPPALDALTGERDLGISAFLLPGHVSAVIGESPYASVAKRGIPGAITGFASLDILGGIHAVVGMLAGGEAKIVNRYPRVVKPAGNPSALRLIDKVFVTCDAAWRGIGTIPSSGLALRDDYARFDACQRFGIAADETAMPQGCACGAVLRGRIHPDQCPLFGSPCTPQTPVGPCMVSSEGSCAAWFKYGR